MDDILNHTYHFYDRKVIVESVEKQILAVNAVSLGCDGQRDNLQVTELGNDTWPGHISLVIYFIFCEILAYIKNNIELCDEIVHKRYVI